MYKANSGFSIPKYQSGVILILSLVILLILTMLIVSSMNATNTQVLMTGNTQYHTQALNDAETALHFAENTVENFAKIGNVKPVSGYYNLKINKSPAIDFSNFGWSTVTAANYSFASRKASYVIEYTGQVPLKGASIAVTQNNNVPGDNAHLFRITARSTTARGAVRLVQSVYVTTAPPQ
ncbi:MAG: PilX N-terminal domain-containing pilus assembly protein [Gammaproteobacteria bacterium]